LNRSQDGSTVVESVLAIVFLLTLLLGTIQVVFTLYSRNVVRAAAQEGARAAIERGAADGSASAAARTAVARTAGGLLEQVGVTVERSAVRGGAVISVTVVGRLRPIGPVPVSVPIRAVAHAAAAEDPR
jgi:Flp pilus assembly protein TadG